ncbi:MAG: hypothetical protein CVV33_00875, partial [Methanomicrobiales archaeon HGW-Methanomicrobiales-4]
DAMVIAYQRVSADLRVSDDELKQQTSISYDALKKAAMITGYSNLEELSYATPDMPHITMGLSRIVGVKVPDINYSQDQETKHQGYSYVGSTSQADEAGQMFEKFLADLIKHAELTGITWCLEQEITSCRRRVNALEQIVIPSLIHTQKYIEMRLEEREREDLFRRKRTKQLLERQEQNRI